MNENELLLMIQLGYFDEEENDTESDNLLEEINSGLHNLFDSLSRLGEDNE